MAGAAAAVLETVFGTGPLPMPSPRRIPQTRGCNVSSPASAQMAEEQRMVRIWGGIHFRNTLEVSEQMGRKVAAHLLSNSMTPVR